jgi:ParB/RepB/Spo0J family partition protein
MTTTRQRIPLEQIAIPENVRGLNDEHVDALAASIRLRGQLVPVIVRQLDDGYELVAGFHRIAAQNKLGAAEIDAEIRDGEDEHADRAVENIARLQLNPYEEAKAVQAMLAEGRLTEEGVAQALGWSRARVTARVKLLELPEHAQQLVGDGRIPASAVDQLRSIGQVSAQLLAAVVEFIADDNGWAAERLSREPGWVLDSVLRQGRHSVFAARLGRLETYGIAELRLGKKIEALVKEGLALHKQLDRYSYGGLSFGFTDNQVDQARAAGVVIEFENSAPIIVDRSLYRELAKDAIRAGVQELRERVAAAEAERKESRRRNNGAAADPLSEGRRQRDRRLREIAKEAHGANLDLGRNLVNGLAAVDPADINVARFFVFGLLGGDFDVLPCGRAGERVAELAVSGIRLVIADFRSDVTQTRKDGSRGALHIHYGNPSEPAEPVQWLWRWIDGARTAEELYGRALMVIAAEQYAARLVVPQSQRRSPTRWASHKDLAAKALGKLARPHLPASLKQVERAVARAQREYDEIEKRAHAAALQRRRRQRTSAAESKTDQTDELGESSAADEQADDSVHEDVEPAAQPAG